MNSKDKEWLLNEFPKYIGKTLMKDTLTAYYKAEMLVNGWNEIKKRGCSCNYKQLKNSTEISYKKWVNESKILKDT